MPRLTFRILD